MCIYIYIYILEYQKFNVLVNHLRAVTQMLCQFISVTEQEKSEFQVKPF